MNDPGSFLAALKRRVRELERREVKKDETSAADPVEEVPVSVAGETLIAIELNHSILIK